MLSEFIELRPFRQRDSTSCVSRQQIKVSFPIVQHRHDPLRCVHAMVMYIGIDLCQPLNLQAGDKIKFFIEENNPRIWQIKRAWNDQGYTLCNPKGINQPSHNVKFQMLWKFFKPPLSEMPTQVVFHEFYDGGICIKLPP